MKTLVIFYTYSGNTKGFAQKLAAQESADILEIKGAARPGAIKAYTFGCLAAMRHNAWPISPVHADLDAYERFFLLAPIWAGNPPPAFHAFLEQLPKGKTIVAKMISASGKSNCRAWLEETLLVKDCRLESFEDVTIR